MEKIKEFAWKRYEKEEEVHCHRFVLCNSCVQLFVSSVDGMIIQL